MVDNTSTLVRVESCCLVEMKHFLNLNHNQTNG